MSDRHSDAIAIADGACNPLAIANALCRGMHEIMDREQGWSTTDLTDDPAIKLMASQLAYLTGVWGGVANFARGADFRDCYSICAEETKPQQQPRLEVTDFRGLPTIKDTTTTEWSQDVANAIDKAIREPRQ